MNTHSAAPGRSSGQSIELYEREYVPTVARPMAYSLLAVAQPRSHEQVLDVACGTGIVARIAAEAVGDLDNITGLDPDQAMLDVAASRAPAGMNWVLGAAEDIPLPDDSFSLALCLQGVQYFTDRHRALAEVLRVLAPGGRFAALASARLPPLLETMAVVLGEHVGPHAERLLRRATELGEPELSGLLSQAGLVDVRTVGSTVRLHVPPPLAAFDLYIAGTPLAPLVAPLDPARRERMRQDFERRTADLPGPTNLVLDYVVSVGSKP